MVAVEQILPPLFKTNWIKPPPQPLQPGQPAEQNEIGAEGAPDEMLTAIRIADGDTRDDDEDCSQDELD